VDRAKLSTRVVLALGGLILALAHGYPAFAHFGMECGLRRQPGCVAWTDRWEGDADRNWGRAVATSPDGSLVFVTANGTDLAYEAATGKLRWVAPNGTSGATGAQDIGTSPSGSLVVSVGERSFPDPERISSGEMVVTAHDPTTGRQRWQARHRSPDNERYTASTLAVTDRRVFVAGQRIVPRQMVILAVDAETGRESWLAHHDGSAKPVDLVATPDGRRVFVTAISWEERPYVQWVTVAYDGATGERLWLARHSGGGESAAQANEMVLHPDGDLLYVTGWGRREGLSGASFDFLTIAYDTSDGTEAWSGGWSPATNSDDLAWSVDVSPDGRRVYVAGYSGSATSSYWVEARGARGGEELWSSLVPLVAPTQDHEGLFGFAKVRSSPDGREVYLAMSAHDETSLAERDVSYAVAGFDAATGEFLWRGAYTDPDNFEASYPNDLAVDPNGTRIYVTGQAWNRGGGFVQTAAFAVGGR
jgi:DNA-binding beta-propeller fold protein YncE